MVDGDVTQPDTFKKLADDLDRAAKQHHTGGNAIFYLAVASALFGPIVESLARRRADGRKGRLLAPGHHREAVRHRSALGARL